MPGSRRTSSSLRAIAGLAAPATLRFHSVRRGRQASVPSFKAKTRTGGCAGVAGQGSDTAQAAPTRPCARTARCEAPWLVDQRGLMASRWCPRYGGEAYLPAAVSLA